MRIVLLLALLGAASVQPSPGRIYHTVALRDLATTAWTHVCLAGPVVYVRRQRDGDVHLTLDDGTAKVVAEIIPLIPIPAPKKGQRVHVCGIARIDKRHGFREIHPVEWIGPTP